MGVETHKGIQTEISGLKGHLIYMTEAEYESKFCKKLEEKSSQTIATGISLQEMTPTDSTKQIASGLGVPITGMESQKSGNSSRNYAINSKNNNSSRKLQYRSGIGSKTLGNQTQKFHGDKSKLSSHRKMQDNADLVSHRRTASGSLRNTSAH